MPDHFGIWTAEDAGEHRFCRPLAAAIALHLAPCAPMIVHDLGAGHGGYASFISEGMSHRVHAWDGFPCHENVVRANLAEPFHAEPGFVLSLEVGEHIPAAYEEVFLDNLARTASRGALISWAVPGQPGRGHVNCRSNEHVIAALAARGLRYHDALSALFRATVDDACPWFRNTLLYFAPN